MNEVKKMFWICALMLVFSSLIALDAAKYQDENTMLRNELEDAQFQLVRATHPPNIECSPLGFCVGDKVELNDVWMEDIGGPIRYNGTVVKLQGDLIIFDSGNENWRFYGESYLRHITTKVYNNETLTKVGCMVVIYDDGVGYCSASFNPETESLWRSNIPYGGK